MRPLRQCLLDTYLVRLRAIARFWDIDLTETRQRGVASELSKAMASPEAIAHAWKTLPTEQRRALEALLTSEGDMPRRVFARQWGEIRTMGPGRMRRERPWEDPTSPAEALWYRGLIFLAFEQGPDGAYEVAFVPPEILEHLPAPEGSPSTIRLEPAPAPTTVHPSNDALLDDACTLLAYLQTERPGLKSGSRWPDRDKDRLLRRLRDDTPHRFALLRHIAFRTGWVHASESGHLRLEPDAVTSWLQSSPDQQRDAMAAAWQDDPTWNDLFHVPSLRPEDTGAWHSDPILARKAILRHLKACTPDKWYSIEDFIAAVKQAAPDFQRPDGDYDTWYIRDADTGAYLSGFESWDAVEGALIRYLITNPLSWLGVVELGDSDEAPMAFRLTTQGAAFLNLEETSPSAEPEPLNLRPGFLVIVPRGRRYERFQLARVADWVSSPPIEEGGSARFVYRLTPSSLECAQQQGISIARVLEFLEEVTEAPVPRSIEAALTRWEARGTEARLKRVVLLRLDDEDLMDQIISSPRTRRLIDERIGPKAALVRERDWQRLIAALEGMGLLSEIVNLEGNGERT